MGGETHGLDLGVEVWLGWLDAGAVVVAGGKVKQEVALRLQHTESGELELEMEWMPLNM